MTQSPSIVGESKENTRSRSPIVIVIPRRKCFPWSFCVSLITRILSRCLESDCPCLLWSDNTPFRSRCASRRYHLTAGLLIIFKCVNYDVESTLNLIHQPAQYPLKRPGRDCSQISFLLPNHNPHDSVHRLFLLIITLILSRCHGSRCTICPSPTFHCFLRSILRHATSSEMQPLLWPGKNIFSHAHSPDGRTRAAPTPLKRNTPDHPSQTSFCPFPHDSPPTDWSSMLLPISTGATYTYRSCIWTSSLAQASSFKLQDSVTITPQVCPCCMQAHIE